MPATQAANASSLSSTVGLSVRKDALLLSSRRAFASSKFSSTQGAVVGGLLGAGVGTYIVLAKGDFSGCANELSSFSCRLGQVAFIAAGAAAGALIGFLLGH